MTEANAERIQFLLQQTQLAIGEIDEYVGGMSLTDLTQNDLAQDAAARVLSIIANSIDRCLKASPSFGDDNPELVAAALSHEMTHLVTEYWTVDSKVIWNLANKNVPMIKREVTRLLAAA